jgi:iron complex outermembrane receptor protein
MFRVVRSLAVALLLVFVPSLVLGQNVGVIAGVVKDSSGGVLPGASVKISSDSSVPGMDLVANADGSYRTEYFAALDAACRSSFSSSATYSRYMVVPGYTVLNARVGFRIASGWTLSVWSRNLLNTNYFELLSAAPGNTGLIVGQPGDARTAGVTLHLSLT